MAGIQVAESTKSRRGPKAIAHLEIHPKLGGGHVVKHVYSNGGAGEYREPKEHHFNEEGIARGGEHITAHLAKHAGLPGAEPYDKHGESETEDEIEG